MSVEISVQFQKILIADIENFAILAANILLIRYIGTPLIPSLRHLNIWIPKTGICCNPL